MVTFIDRLEVAINAVFAVDGRVFAGNIGFVEIPGVVKEAGSRVFEKDGRVGTYEEGYGTGAACRSGVAFEVDGDVGHYDESVAAVPGFGLAPREGVEERVGTPVAGVGGRHTFDVMVARGFEQFH